MGLDRVDCCGENGLGVDECVDWWSTSEVDGAGLGLGWQMLLSFPAAPTCLRVVMPYHLLPASFLNDPNTYVWIDSHLDSQVYIMPLPSMLLIANDSEFEWPGETILQFLGQINSCSNSSASESHSCPIT